MKLFCTCAFTHHQQTGSRFFCLLSDMEQNKRQKILLNMIVLTYKSRKFITYAAWLKKNHFILELYSTTHIFLVLICFYFTQCFRVAMQHFHIAWRTTLEPSYSRPTVTTGSPDRKYKLPSLLN